MEVRIGWKWKAMEAVDVVEARLRHRALMGTVSHTRAGQGSSSTPHYDRAQGKEKWMVVQDEVRASVQEETASREPG